MAIPRNIIDPLTKKILLTIKDAGQAIELEPDCFSRLLEPSENDVTGFYDIEKGIIFLNQGKWCLNTLTHETLHSRSVFSRTPFSANIGFVLEGITELFVGLTFERTLSECNKEWQTIDECFHNDYEEYVKPWHYLQYKFDFLPIEQLYFNHRVRNPIKELGLILERNGCDGCASLFSSYSKNRTAFFEDFKDILGRTFSSEFADFMRTDLRQTIALTEL